jgi:hypothetical protein
MNKHLIKRFLILLVVSYNSFLNAQENVQKNTISAPKVHINQTNSTDSKESETSKSSTNVKLTKKVQYPITISKKAGEEQIVHDKEYLSKEITRINNHILAIDFKVENVSADEKKKVKAEEDGWFEQMKVIRSSLVQDRTKLEEELNLFKN